MRPTTIIPILATAFVLGIVGVAVAQDAAPGPIDDVAAAEKPVQVSIPDDGRQVLVVQYRLVYEQGKLAEVESVRTEQIASIAPKVHVRAGGDWLVTVRGEEEFSFFTFDPARREATPDRETETGYEWVVEDGAVDWTLVVPLYIGEQRFEKVESITIRDAATEEVVIETDL